MGKSLTATIECELQTLMTTLQRHQCEKTPYSDRSTGGGGGSSKHPHFFISSGEGRQNVRGRNDDVLAPVLARELAPGVPRVEHRRPLGDAQGRGLAVVVGLARSHGDDLFFVDCFDCFGWYLNSKSEKVGERFWIFLEKRWGKNKKTKTNKKGRKPSVQTYKCREKSSRIPDRGEGGFCKPPDHLPRGVFNPLLPFDRWEGKENPTRSANFVIPSFFLFSLSPLLHPLPSFSLLFSPCPASASRPRPWPG